MTAEDKPLKLSQILEEMYRDTVYVQPLPIIDRIFLAEEADNKVQDQTKI